MALPGGNGSAASTEARSVQRLRCNLDAFPNCDFFRVEAIVRPWRLSTVIESLSRHGILGMTACPVHGAGVQSGKKERYSGSEHGTKELVEKSRLDVVVARKQVNRVVRIIVKAAQTGEIGDGKIFVHPVADVIRIRTMESGHDAERMEGGMSDMTSSLEEIWD